MGLGSAKQRERKYSSSSITIENQLDTWLAVVGCEKTWCSLAHSLQEVVLHTSIFKHKNWNMTHYSKKAQCARNMILFYSCTCHAHNRCAFEFENKVIIIGYAYIDFSCINWILHAPAIMNQTCTCEIPLYWWRLIFFHFGSHLQSCINSPNHIMI